jgi:hypothetical protein
MLTALGKLMIVTGLGLAAIGVLLLFAPKIPGLGRLPGDIVYRGDRTTFYFPIVTCLLLSAILSLAMWVISLFRR